LAEQPEPLGAAELDLTEEHVWAAVAEAALVDERLAAIKPELIGAMQQQAAVRKHWRKALQCQTPIEAKFFSDMAQARGIPDSKAASLEAAAEAACHLQRYARDVVDTVKVAYSTQMEARSLRKAAEEAHAAHNR
jgi:S-adenosylmethionine:diacylglycerol 3-amino-3-carboxypropyl transferase